MVPASLVGRVTVPAHAGLYVYHPDRCRFTAIEELKRAPRLHTRKASERLKLKVAWKMCDRWWFTRQTLAGKMNGTD